MSRHPLRLISGAALVAVSVIASAAPSYPSQTDPAVSISDIAIAEGDSGTTDAIFVVSLTKAGGKINTVQYATADGTARAGLDYQATSGTLTFNKRETSKTIRVPIIGDTLDEPDETFTVVLSQPSRGLVMGDGTGEGTITDDEPTPPPASADLAVQLTDSPDPVGLGGELTYHVHVVNNGPDAAADVQVTDVLKPYAEFVSASPGCVNDAGTVRCTAAALASGAAYDVDITVRVQTTGAISNTVDVTSGTADPDSGNNTDTEATQVSPQADLRVSLSHQPEPVPLGGTVTFALGLANDGPSSAASSRAELVLPAGLDYSSADPSCGYDAASRTVTCTAGTLVSGGAATHSVAATAASSGAHTVTATAYTSTADSDPANNQATDVVNALGPQADLALTVSGDPATATITERVSYTWTITNNGPQTAQSIQLDATFPEDANLDTFGDGAQGCTYTFANRNLNCGFGDLTNGATHTVTVHFRYTIAGTKTFNSTATSTTADPDTTNNTATTSTTVIAPQADLALTTTGVPDAAIPSERVSYTWTTTNNGPHTAQSAQLEAILPFDANFDSFGDGSTGCVYVFAERRLTCALGDLTNGVTRSVTVHFRYATTGTKIFDSTVTSTTADPDTTNNDTTTITTITIV
ncbi:MAG: Calx-beta domain-containing protein [Micromonosporaceae bacterium]